ncbi:MAG: Alanine racemase, partial [Proteiniphilum sp. 51_7]
MDYTIQQIASILQLPAKELHPANISLLLTDSRRLTDPDATLFFALETRSNDGHRYVAELYREGVRNFVVTKMLPEWAAFTKANFLKVKNSLTALQKIAAWHRSRFDIPVIGITGSNGKTIVKEWLYQLLEKDYNITRSPRSYNSQIGVPLSVWQLDEKSELGIFEAGISLPDEMEPLETMIRPTIGVLTKIGEAHQENFTSLQQKCMEKLELFVNCDVFIFDEDNELVSRCVDLMVLSQKSFSWSRSNRDAPLFISAIEKSEERTLIRYSFLNFEYAFQIPFTDEASIENAINCLAVALYLHVSPIELSERMRQLEPVAMRLELRKGKQECLIINDTYNSDINSIRIALDFQQQRRLERSLTKTVILSDILQSGLSPRSLYRRVAELTEQAGIDKLIGIGPDITANAELFALQEKVFFPSTDEFIRSGLWKSFRG